jgi:putative adenylate-forming enzyme
MQARERWSRERLVAYQQQQLNSLVEYAIKHSPYYRDAIGRIDTDEVRLSDLPILSRATLAAEFDQIVTDPRLRLAEAERHLAGPHADQALLGEYRVVGSGGTSGQRSIIIYNRDAWEIVLSEILYVMAVQGIDVYARVIGIGAPTPLHMTNRLFADLGGERSGAPRLAVTTPLPEIVAALNAYKPDAIITYPSLIRRLAEEQRAGRLALAAKQFCSVAETLSPAVRQLAHDVWGAVVLDDYGATEAGLVAVECPHQSGLHIPEDRIILEVVDADNRAVPAGVPGIKLLLTNLFNHTLPLIRYEISDIVSFVEGCCPCGRTHRRLAAVGGRREDVLVLPGRGGGRVEVNAFLFGEALLHVPAISQYQLVPGDGELSVKLVLRDGSESAPALEAARHVIESEFGKLGASVAKLTILAVKHIPRKGTGAKERPIDPAA